MKFKPENRIEIKTINQNGNLNKKAEKKLNNKSGRKFKQYQNNIEQKTFKNTTVNSEFFARGLFSRNFAYAKFRENKTLAK